MTASLFIKTTHLLAYLGGLLMVMLAALVGISVVGRVFFSMPIAGDYEIVKMLTALAIFSFLPFSFLQKTHVVMELPMGKVSTTIADKLDRFWNYVSVLFFSLISYGLFCGAQEAYKNGERMMEQAIFLWPAFLITACLCAISALSHFWLTWWGGSHFATPEEPQKTE